VIVGQQSEDLARQHVKLGRGWHALGVAAPVGAAQLWILRQQGLYLRGLLSIALMSLAMLLASCPVWLEAPLGGMNRVHRGHKWAGILACAFAVLNRLPSCRNWTRKTRC
jgi:predicted ferric reductase